MDREKLIEKLEYIREGTSDEVTENSLSGLIRSLEEERMFWNKEVKEEAEKMSSENANQEDACFFCGGSGGTPEPPPRAQVHDEILPQPQGEGRDD